MNDQKNRVWPRANNKTILSNEYVQKTIDMLNEYGETCLTNFAIFWEIKYNEIIELNSGNKKYDGGLLWFIRDNSNVFNLRQGPDGYWFVSNKQRFIRDSYRHESIKANVDMSKLQLFKQPRAEFGYMIFNADSFLWLGQPWAKYLDETLPEIPLSAYELNLEVKFYETNQMVKRIRQKLFEFPYGLQLERMYRYIDINAILKLFNVSTSTSSVVDELPEIFYRKFIGKANESIVFDGFITTIDDLSGREDSHFPAGSIPEAIATQAVNEGLYQLTLLLIRRTGQQRGLKINVWRQAMKKIFFKISDDEFDSMFKFDTMSFFRALARFELLELRSNPDCKNDIRAFLPLRPIEYVELKTKLNDLVNLDNNSESDSV